MVGCNQPQQDPSGGSLATDAWRVNFMRILRRRSHLVDIKKNITSILDRMTDKQLRLIYLVAYEIVKKPTKP